MHTLLRDVRRAFEANDNPDDAAPMEAYMKGKGKYYGIKSKARRDLQKPIFTAHIAVDTKELEKATRALYFEPARREEQYAALDFLALTKHRKLRTPALLPLYEEMIVTGAWWDLIDGIATQRMGELLKNWPEQLRPLLLRWATDDDLWKRRTAILAQNRFKADTDLELLYACIEPSIEEKEFFLRKAIGWALRDLSRAKPDEVRRYVKDNETRLSGLSKREALKHL